MRAVAVMGAPRLEPCPPDAVFGECRDCHIDLMWSGRCPDLPKLCVGCVGKIALERPDTLIVLPSGSRAIRASHAVSVH